MTSFGIARAKLGMTIDDVSKEAGVSAGFYIKLEKGVPRRYHLVKVYRVCTVLGIDFEDALREVITWLYPGSDTPGKA